MPTAPPSCLVAHPSDRLAHAWIDALKSLKLNVLPPQFDGLAALNAIVRYQPTLALFGDDLPDLDSFGLLEHLLDNPGPTQIIVHTRRSEPETILRALLLGARGYLLHDADPDELHACAWMVSKGGFYVSPVLLDGVLSLMRRTMENRPNPYGHLSHREREVLLCIAKGLTTAEIAYKLHPQVSHKTVETHRENLRAKLGVVGSGSALLKEALNYLNWENENNPLKINELGVVQAASSVRNPDEQAGFSPD